MHAALGLTVAVPLWGLLIRTVRNGGTCSAPRPRAVRPPTGGVFPSAPLKPGMGYACPVCGAEQADGVHLANHLAVTASVGRADHREWLETHAPDWGECGPEELAERAVEYATEIETPGFDDAGGRAPNLEAELAAQTRRPGRGGPAPGGETGRVDAVLEEARELTERMSEGDEASAADGAAEADDTPERDRATEAGDTAERDPATDAGQEDDGDA